MARLIRPVLTAINRALFPREPCDVTVKTGPARGLQLHFEPPFKTQRWLGLEEVEIAPAFAKWIPRAGAFVDIGAHDGYYTAWVAARNRTARVIACEADPAFRELCKKSLRLNGLEFGERISWIDGFAGTSGVTLDSMMRSLAEPILVKIDVEGAEVDVLRSGRESLLAKQAALIVEVHSEPLEQEAGELLRSLGYGVEVIKNAWWRAILPEPRSLPLNRWLVAERPAGQH